VVLIPALNTFQLTLTPTLLDLAQLEEKITLNPTM
jgi:hypothetical protein